MHKITAIILSAFPFLWLSSESSSSPNTSSKVSLCSSGSSSRSSLGGQLSLFSGFFTSSAFASDTETSSTAAVSSPSSFTRFVISSFSLAGISAMTPFGVLAHVTATSSKATFSSLQGGRSGSTPASCAAASSGCSFVSSRSAITSSGLRPSFIMSEDMSSSTSSPF